MTVKLIHTDGSLAVPIPSDIIPQNDQYNVFQTQEGVILCIPDKTLT